MLWNTPGVPEATSKQAVTNGGVIAVAIGAMNVATYGFTIIAARALGPDQYGAFAAVMNLLMVVSVAQLALQATAARRISSTPGDVSVIEAGIRRDTWLTAIVLGLSLAVAAPLVNHLLRLESLLTALLVGAIAVPLTVMGGQAGTLQGERRWRPLAVLYAAAGVPRLAVGTALILWRPEEFTAILGVFIGALAPVAVGMVALRHRAPHDAGPSDEDHGFRALFRELGHNSQALLAFFAVTNVDVILARSVLDNADSGLYAGGLILTKAVLFLPQFVVVVAFPDMADANERRRALRLSLGAVAGLGVVGIAATYVLSSFALVFVGKVAEERKPVSVQTLPGRGLDVGYDGVPARMVGGKSAGCWDPERQIREPVYRARIGSAAMPGQSVEDDRVTSRDGKRQGAVVAVLPAIASGEEILRRAGAILVRPI